MSQYPRWTWADAPPFTPGLRAEIAFDQFVDYVLVGGVWRQKTAPMTNKESIAPERHRLGGWRVTAAELPEVDVDMAEWLTKTYDEIGAAR